MGKHYVHIDSHDKAIHERDSKMTIYLNPPLHNVHSVQVKRFSIANELFNILEGNNELEFVIFKYSTVTEGVGAPPSVTSHTKVIVEFPPGLYTTQEMVDFFNTDIGDPKHTSNRNDVTISMALLANNKVQIRAESNHNAIRHMIIHCPTPELFKTSVAHRLGFSSEQLVFSHSQSETILNTFITRYNDPTKYFMALDFEGSEVRDTETSYLLWRTHDAAGGRFRVSNNIGFETYPFIHIVSNELSKHSQKTNKTTGGAVTIPCNILQTVQISGNMFDWIHLYGNMGITEHMIDGRTIHHFDIGLADNIGNLFQQSHYKDFSLELEFTTTDEAEEKNKEAIDTMVRQTFFARHSK